MENKIYAGDVGTEILLDTGENISTASSLKIIFKNRQGTGEWVGAVVETTKIRYITVADDLKEGDWQLQASVVMPGRSGLGETVDMKVHAKFS